MADPHLIGPVPLAPSAKTRPRAPDDLCPLICSGARRAGSASWPSSAAPCVLGASLGHVAMLSMSHSDRKTTPFALARSMPAWSDSGRVPSVDPEALAFRRIDHLRIGEEDIPI